MNRAARCGGATCWGIVTADWLVAKKTEVHRWAERLGAAGYGAFIARIVRVRIGRGGVQKKSLAVANGRPRGIFVTLFLLKVHCVCIPGNAYCCRYRLRGQNGKSRGSVSTMMTPMATCRGRPTLM